MISQICVFALMVLAGIVSVQQSQTGDKQRSAMWVCICLYWVVLTAKNLCDLLGV